MDITQRTIKMVGATIISIWIALALGLEHPMAAGIIAILSVLDTKQDSITTGIARLLSTVLAFVIASIVFSLMDFSVLAFGLYLTFYVPIAYKYHLEAGIAPCSVLVTHFVGAESISWFWQVNGLLIMAVGTGMAILFNSWMPSRQKEIVKLKEKVEEEMRSILRLFQTQLLGEQNTEEITIEIKELGKRLNNLNQLSLQEFDNQIFSKSNYYIKYAQMRKEQFVIIRQMEENIPYISLTTEQNKILATLFEKTANELHEKNTGIELLELISDLYKVFRTSSLPKTREEFESRSSLLQLLYEFERFIEIKRNFLYTEDMSA